MTPIRLTGWAERCGQGDRCPHSTYVLNDDSLMVFCQDCGERLEPLWVLKKLALRYSDRDRRWEAVKEYEKHEAIDARAHLCCEAPGVYRTDPVLCDGERLSLYRVERTGKRWAIRFRGAVIRYEASLDRARRFVRRHVEALWGKEAHRDAAIRAATLSARRYDDERCQCGHRYRGPGKARLARCPNLATGRVGRKWRCPDHGGPATFESHEDA